MTPATDTPYVAHPVTDLGYVAAVWSDTNELAMSMHGGWLADWTAMRAAVFAAVDDRLALTGPTTHFVLCGMAWRARVPIWQLSTLR